MGVDGAGYAPARADVFATNGDGTLSVIHQDTTDKYHVVGSMRTPRGRPTVVPRTFTLLVIEA